MSAIISKLKTNLKYGVGLMIASLVGGLTSAVVLAAIPDTNGIIHGCRSNINGGLRVVDSEAGGTCLPSETPLNWNQTGPAGPTGTTGATGAAGATGPKGDPGEPLAYAYIDVDGNLVSYSSSGVTAYSRVAHPTIGSAYLHCFTLSSTPKNAVATANNRYGEAVTTEISGLSENPNFVTDNCGASAHAFVMSANEGSGKSVPFFVLFN